MREHLCILALCTPSTCPYYRQTCQVIKNATESECTCHCTGSTCQALEPMCADDGVTHMTYREFEEWKCWSKNYHVKLAYWGKCQSRY